MRFATTPSQPPAAPQRTSTTFHAMPSFEPLIAWTISIAPEYTATYSAPAAGVSALAPSALRALNPTSAKAVMLYAFRSSTWNESSGGDVRSYTSLLVAAQNSAAASASATTPQILRARRKAGEPS